MSVYDMSEVDGNLLLIVVKMLQAEGLPVPTDFSAALEAKGIIIEEIENGEA